MPAEDGEENRSRLAGELAHIRAEYRDRELRRGESPGAVWKKPGKSERRCRLEERCRALAWRRNSWKEAAKLSGDGMERRISDRMSEIFARITDGRYRSNGSGKVEERIPDHGLGRTEADPGGAPEPGNLEQIYFALRMAAADVLLEEPFRSYWTTYLHFMMTKDWDLYYNGWEAGGSR